MLNGIFCFCYFQFSDDAYCPCIYATLYLWSNGLI
uniref:Uncharacterized protein n=1 Tax=Manihot esculenta TaxID=3983 RepID=A0A2C9VZX9_MANES